MQKNRGFTLVEMAIALVVIGLVVSGGFGLVGPIVGSKKVTETAARLNRIEAALQVYVIQNGCLPCPANGTLPETNVLAGFSSAGAVTYGPWPTGTVPTGLTVQTCTNQACLAVNGVVPGRTLGLPESETLDPWGNRIRYAVAGTGVVGATVQDTDGMRRSLPSSYPVGTLSVDDLEVAAGPEQTAAVYVLVSSGPDGSMALRGSTGTVTADRYGQTGGGGGQDENRDNDTVFAFGYLNSVPGVAHFDDITRFRTAPFIVQKCGAGACGNPDPLE